MREIWLRGPDLNRRPSGYEPDELPDCSTPRQSWGGSIRPIPLRVNVTFHLQESPQQRALLIIGTEKGTRTPTPYGHNHLKVACLPIPPPRHRLRYCMKLFLLLLLSWRYVSRISCRLLLLEHRDIIRSRLLLWNFKYCWVWQTYLSQLMSFLFSKVT